jgi:hypothetical protein
VAQQVGQPRAEHVEHAGRVVEGLPPALLEAAREPLGAQALVFALLLCRADQSIAARQLQALQAEVSLYLHQQTQRLAGVAAALVDGARLSLLDLAMPALKKSSPRGRSGCSSIRPGRCCWATSICTSA